jgi:dolichyl-phosphate beta-glucosyltransferase
VKLRTLYNIGKEADVTSLILPAYNPGPAVERTWESVRDFLRARPDPWEVLFVLDGCTDGTAERLNQWIRETKDSRCRVISYSPNQGKGYAVRTGLLAAKGEWRVFTDIDLAYRFEDIARTADELRLGASVAIASREHPESTIQLPPRFLPYAYRRRLQSHVFGSIARTLLPLTQLDTQAGLKGMTAEVAERVLPNLQCNGFGFDCEFLTACARYGFAVNEVPVAVRYEDAASTTGLRTTLKMFRELWQIRQNWPATGFPPLAERKALGASQDAAQAA